MGEGMHGALDTPIDHLNQMASAGFERGKRQHHAATQAAKLEELLLETL